MGQYKSRADFLDAQFNKLGNSTKNALGLMIEEKTRNKQKEDELQKAIQLAEVKQRLENQGKKEALTAILGKNPGEIPTGFRPEGFTYEGINFKRSPSEEEQMTARSSKLSDEIAKKELSSMATNLPKLEQALQSVNQLESLYFAGASPDKNPLLARTSGVFDVMKAKAGFNPSLNSYMNNSKAFSGLIAKGGFGEAGMLTNQDIERVLAALPTSMSTPDEAKMGFSEIKRLLGAARDRFEKTKQSYLSGEITSPRVFNGQPQAQTQINKFNGQSIGQNALKTGGQLMVDAQGNRAMVYPDGTIEEVQ